MRRVTVIAALGLSTTVLLLAVPSSAAEEDDDWFGSGSVSAEVATPPSHGGGNRGGSNSGDAGGGSGGGPSEQSTGPTRGTACSPMPGSEFPCPTDDPAAPVDPVVVAQMALDRVTFSIPEPRTSPEGHQLTGLATWFWLDPDQWLSHTARAELPGVWAEVTASPVSVAWDPGDGSAPVVCDGPGRPATSGGEPDCAHVYTVVGDYTLTVRVTYAVTWRSSTGASGTLDAIVLASTAPVEVQQRQAVTD